MAHVESFDSMDEAFAAMAAYEDIANTRLLPGQIRLRDAVTETVFWAQPIPDDDLVVYGRTPPIAEVQAGADFDVTDNRERGYLTGVAYSAWETDGEHGDTHVSQVIPISQSLFEALREAGFPTFAALRDQPEHNDLLQRLAISEVGMRS